MNSTEAPVISVCVPARNEEVLIGRCLESIRSAERALGEPVEILVSLNRCTDGTESIARSYNAVLIREDAKNLAKIRNAAAKVAQGRILVTIDADSRMSANMLTEIKRHLDSGKAIGGGVFIKPERISLGIFLTAIVIAIVLIPFRISAGLFWCLKKDFDAIGGFDETLITGEDVNFAWRLKNHGRKSGKRFKTIVRAHIVSSCRKFDQFGDWYYLNPVRLWKFFKGSDQVEADRHWYEVKR